MWIILIAVAVLAGLLGLCAVALILWLGRSLRWSVIEDDEIDFGKKPRSKLFRWFNPKHNLLTYRRDRLGRFRRHRR